MKIVAFIDTLGFKQKITSINHQQAVEVIRSFNSQIYNLWSDLNYNNDGTIHGQTFSDSLIIHTDDSTNASLRKILTFLNKLYKISITQCDLPLRGGIAIGDFDHIPATEFSNLQKGLVVGTAFIDAYLLESANKIKGSKIIFKAEIHNIITEHFPEFSSKELLKLEDGQFLYEMPWGNIEYLSEDNDRPLSVFVDLATRSKWIDHYFHTLDTFLTKESQRDKHEIFRKIVNLIRNNYRYNDLDNFIENFFKTDGIVNLKKSFSSYIRERIEF